MAAVSFTDVDGTPIATNDANWAGVEAAATGNSYAVEHAEINSNLCEPIATFNSIGAYYSGSGVDESEIDFIGGATVGNRAVAVRMGSGQLGYGARLEVISGGDYTRLYVYKNGSYIGSFGNISEPIANTHTVKITASGTSTVTLEGFIDGVSIGTIVDAASTITSGDPGIYAWRTGNLADLRFDNWTDNAAAGGALLDAAVSCAATVVAALTTAVTVAASVAASGVIAAVLTTSILLGGAVTGTASTAAALTTDIRLDAAPALTVNATGTLATAIPLFDAAVTATASQAANLTTQIEMGSTVSATAAATGWLTVGLNLDAAVTGSAAADGILSTQIPLTASIAATSVTASQLTTGISLAANAGGQAASTGEIATDITLTANAASAASASGILNAQKIFNTVQRSANFQAVAAKTALFNVTRNNTVFFTRNRTKEVLF